MARKTTSRPRAALLAAWLAVSLLAIALNSPVLGAAPLTTLYRFTGGADGANPTSSVLEHDGTLYGTTVNGGTHGKGTVFQLTPPTMPGRAWTEVVLYSFAGGTDGANPYGDLLLDRTGTLYGTTAGSGTEDGTVFRLTPPSSPSGHWTETVLHRFVLPAPGGDADGFYPTGNSAWPLESSETVLQTRS